MEIILVNYKLNNMRKVVFLLLTIFALSASAQTTLDERVTLLKSSDFNIKLKVAMQQVAVGILTAPLSENADSAAVQLLKKNFAKNIVEQGGERYIFPIVASGQVSDQSSDLVLIGVITQMFNYFAAFRQEQQ
jgi:hypothetical protein